MTLLTQEQILELDLAGCQKALNQMEREYRLDTVWYDLTPKEWSEVDQITNCLLDLENRIKEIQASEQAQEANRARWQDHIPKPKPIIIKQVRPRRQFRIGDVVYADVQTAALKIGVKVETLRQYSIRKPEQYEFLKDSD